MIGVESPTSNAGRDQFVRDIMFDAFFKDRDSIIGITLCNLLTDYQLGDKQALDTAFEIARRVHRINKPVGGVFSKIAGKISLRRRKEQS